MSAPRSLRTLADVSFSERPGPAFAEGISLPISCEEWFAIQRALESLSEKRTSQVAYPGLDKRHNQRASAVNSHGKDGGHAPLDSGLQAQSEAHPKVTKPAYCKVRDEPRLECLPDLCYCAPSVPAKAEAHQSASATPRTDAIRAELMEKYPEPLTDKQHLLYYMEIAECYGQEARELERELAEAKDTLLVTTGMLQQGRKRAEAAEQSKAAAVAQERDAGAEDLSHAAFLCHTHDEFGKGRERGFLDAVKIIRARSKE